MVSNALQWTVARLLVLARGLEFDFWEAPLTKKPFCFNRLARYVKEYTKYTQLHHIKPHAKIIIYSLYRLLSCNTQ